MPADKDSEIFEVVDQANKVVGTALRGVCHAEGLFHRSVYCLIFNLTGQLLLQQRSSRKKIGPLQWDLSVAEHLQPKESYKEAVQRGVQEELGITVPLDKLKGPLAPAHLRTLHIPGVLNDCEFVECYRLDGWEGELQLDEDEVQAVRWVTLPQVYKEMAEHPEEYTQWFRDELAMMQPLLLPN